MTNYFAVRIPNPKRIKFDDTEENVGIESAYDEVYTGQVSVQLN